MDIATVDWKAILPIIIPVIAIQLILQVVALVDLYKREKVLGKKWVWVLVIILGEIIGAAIYLLVGRKEA